jgi:plastocyanin
MSRLPTVTTNKYVFALVAMVAAMGLMTLGCGSENSPTAPDEAGGTQNPSGSTGGSTAGTGIDLEKSTNGHDADEAPGPEIDVGDQVTWTYVVKNTGQSALTHIVLSDDKLGEISCPSHNLTPGATMTCTARGVAEEGQYQNIGRVVGNTPDSRQVSDEDRSHYLGIPEDLPRIDLEKYTNGENADEAPGPEILVGETVTWTYSVVNTGKVRLVAISVTDDMLGDISCPSTTLEPGKAMRCTAHGVAVEGQYTNLGTAIGYSELRQQVTDTDPSHYLGVSALAPSIDLEKYTNGVNADRPSGPRIEVGQTVTWTYSVINNGEVPLAGIAVTDDQLGAISCPSTTLEPGKAMRCTAEGLAVEGQYRNVGKAVGYGPDRREAVDEDPSHYFGYVDETGEIGCSHGYWKNHASAWMPTGYSPQDTVGRIFPGTIPWPEIAASSLREALDFGGGPGVEGAVKNLMRQAVAALLNAAHPDVPYPRTVDEVIALVDRALASNDRNAILTAKDLLDHDNNLGCPLN